MEDEDPESGDCARDNRTVEASMNRLKVAALVVTPLLLLAGCSAFFGFNAYAALDKPAAPKVSDYSGSDGLTHLANDLASKAVVEAMKGDPADTQAIETWLQTTYNNGALTDNERQTAAALYADVNLKTTEGESLVNNVVSALMTTPPSGNLQSLLASILPPGALADEPTFTAMMIGLLNAEAAYMVLGSLPTPPGPPVNLGDVAQKAAVCYLADAIVSGTSSFLGSPPQATTLHQLYLLAIGDPSNTVSTVSIADPFPSNPAWLVNIFGWSGATYPS
jgi:hypothetical protein